ncbi:hypothetical protein AXW83_22480 [Bosea sp. PAMC 26642]|nr:hypothetical protein AXW83_22480 [Bosea sp. PAMC 26642]
MRGFIASNTAKADAQIHVIESGIDLGRFSPTTNLEGEPGQKPFVVGYLGRMSPEKNPLGFVDLAERLHQVIPELRFRIYGEGPMAAQVSARIASSSASKTIVFEGFAESSAAALAEIDVLVVPSKLDGRPNVIMEANGCGVPVIGAPVGGIPELIVPGVNGFVLAPDRHIEITDLLARWLADPMEFAVIQASSRSMAEKRFDRSRMMDAYEAVYRRFLPAG